MLARSKRSDNWKMAVFKVSTGVPLAHDAAIGEDTE